MADELTDADPGCAVLVADPATAWAPTVGKPTLVAVAEWSDGHRSRRPDRLRDGDVVTVRSGPGADGDHWCMTPDGAWGGHVAARHLRPVPAETSPDQPAEHEDVPALRAEVQRLTAERDASLALLRARLADEATTDDKEADRG